MSSWILQHFLNPALFWPGVALAALPIIIHLINRMRYKRVRFAAMEFLLASEQKNRRRVLLEQLLLLLARILLVLLILALIGRLIVDPKHLSLFQGARTHHVILLDDTGSMRDRLGESSVFDQARDVVRGIIAQGAERPGTQRVTLVMLSNPTETSSGLTERDVDAQLLDDSAAQLQDLTCSFRTGNPVAALSSVRSRLISDRATEKVLHILSDFRKPDWYDNGALISELEALDNAQVSLNLVRLVNEQHENLAITDLTGAVETAAVGVPIVMRAKVLNAGKREVNTAKLAVAIDGQALNRREPLPPLPAGETREVTFDVDFASSGLHRVEVSLEADALEADNIRRIAVDVPQSNPVLVIDGTAGAVQGRYVADALAADQSVTGYSVTIDGPEGLRKRDLTPFALIYLLNVSDLPPDATDAVRKYVRDGGGLAFFAGETLNSTFYNKEFYASGKGLLPVSLAPTPTLLPPAPGTTPTPDLVVTDHPVFAILAGQENPLIDFVKINAYFAVDASAPRAEGTRVIASLRDGAPLMLESEYGQGRVLTCLTAAGPTPLSETMQKLAIDPDSPGEVPPAVWNNWASGNASPTFVVAQLEIARRLARKDRALPHKIVGEEIAGTLDQAIFLDDVEIRTPDDQVIKIKADHAGEGAENASAATTSHTVSYHFRETDSPGVYGLRRFRKDQTTQETLLAYNVPPQESQLELITDDQLKKQMGGIEFTIQSPGETDWLRRESPGEEVRWWLLWGLILIGLLEQTLASRVSYHSAANQK